jgi:hypothetical protein
MQGTNVNVDRMPRQCQNIPYLEDEGEPVMDCVSRARDAINDESLPTIAIAERHRPALARN